MDVTNFRTAAELPPAEELIAEARAAMESVADAPADPDEAIRIKLAAASKVLDAYAPAIDELVDSSAAAAFLGYKDRWTVHRMTKRVRADGSRAWPDPDRHFGQSPVWALRKIVLSQARAPGRGHKGASLGRAGSTGRRDAPRDDKGRLT